ncbi:hypothetical protein [Streptococcus uberis]|uniref:hypothetical protein n=1 Tax=Streptococcus uberis TaxID=1349 RepID=UPI00062176F9|nr:hypothetical protein [Streptococcus uberis]KKF40870.1 hypothetical protein AF64_08890 [Streptococcus uberis C9359]KKF51725.1 hypothetical protein AF65_08950 [Streptococcus uberis C5388]QBX22096.1 hypothetical protein Javan633_0043 [Streptococcus phage Javan633]QBX31287.1 hypothetical protein Javan628_0043 [Streptococcus phage Javan628]
MFKVTFEAKTLHDLDYMIDEFMHRFNKGQGSAVNIVEKSPKKEEQVEEKPIEQIEVSEVKDFTLTMNDIKRLTKAKLEEGKSAQVKELLADFEVGKVSQLVEDQFISFSERLEEL